MRIIKQLAHQINDEVCGALEYAKDAVEYKATHPRLAEQYHSMAQTEYKHANALHEYAVEEIKKTRESGITPPQKMLNKWDSQHNELIEKLAEAKTYIELYN
jgi:ferritin